MTREEATWIVEMIRNRSTLTDAETDAMNVAIEALERKKGNNISENGFLCSECGFGDFGGFHGYEPNFCPNCGADMRGENDER